MIEAAMLIWDFVIAHLEHQMYTAPWVSRP